MFYVMTDGSVKMRAVTASERTFKGRTADERRAERRARLLDAALQIIGTRGWSEATMTEICRTAGLTERYFYESFRTRDELYVALLDGLGDELRDAVFAALDDAPADPTARLRAVAAAVVGLLVDDPVKGRTALLEGVGSAALEQRRREIVNGFVDLLDRERASFFGDAPISRRRRTLSAAAMAGAVGSLLARHLDGTLAVSRAALVDYLTEMAVALGLGPSVGDR